MTERWVVNASPLIVLARVGLETLFSDLAQEVIVPEAVAEEVLAGPSGDRARQLLEANRFAVVEVGLSVDLLGWDLGAGETAVLSFALAHPGWIAVLDDAAARRCARSYGISVKGTLAIVITAKQKGLIPSAREVLRSLQSSGFRLDDSLVKDLLARTVSEAWD